MKIFLVLAGLLCLVFACFLLGPADSVVESPSLPEPVVVSESPYAHGYERGRASFLLQMGEDVPMPPAVRYVTGLEPHEVSEEEMRGYVDGYHRAADGMHCPGSCTK